MDKLLAMEVFVRVVEAGSFVKAADQLGISTTSASRLVADLETSLGTRLLQRTTRRSSLTATGAEYFARCQQILGAVAEAETLAGLEAAKPTGSLHVSAPVVFGTLHLVPMLAEFHRRYADVHVDLALADRVVDLVDEGFDLAVRIAARLADTLVARRLCTVRLVLCAAPRYLQRHGTPRSPHDCARHACLLYTLSPRPDEWQFETAHGNVNVRVHGALRSNNGDLLRRAALAGEGLVISPTFMVGDDLASGRLVPLMPRFRQADVAAYAVYPTRRHLPAKVRAFVDVVAGMLADPPPWDDWMRRQPRHAPRRKAIAGTSA